MASKAYRIIPVAGVRESNHRAIVFLEADDDKWVNAFHEFSKIQKAAKQKEYHDVSTRFDYWIDGNTHNLWFHGWSDPKYRNCFVFKWKRGGVNQRFYGFLCHPRASDLKFVACVLATYATKSAHNTDEAILDRINSLRVDNAVADATHAMFAQRN